MKRLVTLLSLFGYTDVLVVQGMKLVTGSIDALELLGKKTFNVLTERHSDTGRRRLIFNKEKSTLSQVHLNKTQCY